MTRKHLNDTELDALVVRSLARLPMYGPSRRFAANVMSRVALPAPRAVRRWQRARAWLAQPRRALAFAGAYAALAVIALAVVIPWLLTNSPALGLAYDWTLARSVGMLRDFAVGFTGWAVTSGLAGLVRSVPFSGPSLLMFALGATVAYTGCAIGLHYLLRAPREKHAPIHVQS